MNWPLSIFPFQSDLLRFLQDEEVVFRPVWVTQYTQLASVAAHADDQGAQSIAVEAEYIDRDFMEDYGIFYSRNLLEYPNYCTRLHFFKTSVEGTRRNLLEIGGGLFADKREYLRRCRAFSQESYLGFCVIKPLDGTPVGRTVLRNESVRNDDLHCEFSSTRLYHAHFAGVDLSVRGLPFQQQDVGVSACATTALWSSLNKARDLEDIGPSTPAQITNLASQHTLPFGRSMPSEGLSVDQMCQAVRAIGLAPHLLQFNEVREPAFIVYSALKSGFAPVIVMEKQDDEELGHAITGIGFELGPVTKPKSVATGSWLKSESMRRIFVHDDRIGPSLSAHLKHNREKQLVLSLDGAQDEAWIITHLLLPLHAKIRISLVDLHTIMVELLAALANDRQQRGLLRTPIAADAWIAKGVDYFEQLRFGEDKIHDPSFVQRYAMACTYSRYVGIIRFSADDFGTIDVLVDTTSTLRNLNLLSAAAIGVVGANTQATLALLAKFVGDEPIQRG